ncbi:MAG: N-acetyl-gamma-glutamyl-phosphate reductase [Alphaproteobacteria bacterium]
MIRLLIDGESGTTGLQLVQRLPELPPHQRLTLPEAERKNPAAKRALYAQADIVVLCLPDDAAMEAVALCRSLDADSPRILDASSAHRTRAGWVYGLPELSANQPTLIAHARRVSNPGCYATGAIALLAPLVQAGVLAPTANISINAVSGYSGGGKSMIEQHTRNHGPAFELYGLGLQHKHVGEIQAHAGLAARPLFVPSVGHFAQGMVVSIPLFTNMLTKPYTAEALRMLYAEHYNSSPHIRVEPAQPQRLEAELTNSDGLDIVVCASPDGEQLLLIAKLDNLGKGASGAAIQNLRLMMT